MVMTTGLGLVNTSLLLTHGLHTVTGRQRRLLECIEFPEELAHNVTPAILDGQLQERDDKADAVQSLQQAAVAAIAAEDASRRTWTQARPFVNQVCPKRGDYPTIACGPLWHKRRKGQQQKQGQETALLRLLF